MTTPASLLYEGCSSQPSNSRPRLLYLFPQPGEWGFPRVPLESVHSKFIRMLAAWALGSRLNMVVG